MKYNEGRKVRVKKDLLVGAEYSNEDGTIFDVCSFRMKNNLGKEAIIIGIEEGKYRLNIDKFFLYTDNMLEDLESEKISREDYVYNLEVESVVGESLKLIPEQLINDAIDRGDEKRFMELAKYFEK